MAWRSLSSNFQIQPVDGQGAIVKQGLFFLFDFHIIIFEHNYIIFIAFSSSSSKERCDIHPSASTRFIATLKGTYVVQ